MSEHDQALASAFDDQAEKFERAPVQSDPAALGRLVREADLTADSLVLDAGCGPGLVAEAFLNAGHRVVGVDLSSEMIARAQRRCATFGDRARFERRSVSDPSLRGPFDAAVSRYVLHHVSDQPSFIARQVELLRPGGILVLSDHTTDLDPGRSAVHEELERGRDKTHTRNLTAGDLVDLFGEAGLIDVRMVEERFTLDFDEWFDRGTPSLSKAEVRTLLLANPGIRGFHPVLLAGDRLQIDCFRAIVRGVKPMAIETADVRPKAEAGQA
ncbi:class I SAM-dependent methyltransferase [Singulisphaera acidiphila]|uniref:Methyltransferase family protein n=1 Tax=Singulisphaera acidiphila (strain ATCC BAA-1392 / DSM 18658 / VKM B-2454 / MOB10) TaxID=886293 RepID=L0DNY1_SINAD|nr:class I SAM-dependent methyltransferase [Singulisphaera acidiphila]AGA30563.1 methyltransferase family protein [Singulisphaera acidiphila DSM 18658]